MLIIFIVGSVFRDVERKSMSVERSVASLIVLCSIFPANFDNSWLFLLTMYW